jgi:hypothetical protein
LRRRAGRHLNAFPALKHAIRRIERMLMPGLSLPAAASPPMPGPAVDPVRAPRAERALRDLDRERRRHGGSTAIAR